MAWAYEGNESRQLALEPAGCVGGTIMETTSATKTPANSLAGVLKYSP